MTRIVILTNAISGGGAERSMNLTANALTKLGYETTIIAMKTEVDDYVKLECGYYSLDLPKKIGPFGLLIGWCRLQLLLVKIKPNFLILNCDLPELLGSLSFSSNIIVVEHNSRPWYTRVKIGVFTRKLLLFRKVTWVSVSNAFKIWPFNLEPIETIRNPIILGEEKKLFGPIKRLVSIGRITYQKDPEMLIRLASKLKLPVLLIGDGDLKQNIEKLCLNIEVDADLPGYLSNPWSLFKDGDLLVIPSRFEGDALVPIEAISLNLPLIMSDIPEFRELRLPEINYASNFNEFYEAINNNLNSEKFRIPGSIRKELLSQRSSIYVGNKWHQLFQKFGNEKSNGIT